MKKRLSSQSGARRLAVALALCAALLLGLGQTALAQTVTIKGFTFTLPDGAELSYEYSDSFSFSAASEDSSLHELEVCVDSKGISITADMDFGVSLDWIYEQLDKGDGEHMQNLIHDQPTLFLHTVEYDEYSIALAAVKINGSYITGVENQWDTQSTGDLLLQVLSSVEFDAP